MSEDKKNNTKPLNPKTQNNKDTKESNLQQFSASPDTPKPPQLNTASSNIETKSAKREASAPKRDRREKP